MVAAVRPRALKVPEVTLLFWIAKATTTALGESTSDWLVHTISPVLAVLLGFIAFCAALGIQFAVPEYRPWAYWLAVAMVGVFGTMAADVLHVRFGVAYGVSKLVFGVVLVCVFASWHLVEGTLSMHSIRTPRREIFYWLAVVATFALGTAAGDLTAVTFQLGYLESAVLFAAVIGGIATSYRWLELNSVVAFWSAYVLTRPLGASVADWLGLPGSRGGIGIGTDVVSLVLAVFLALLVAHLQLGRTSTPYLDREPVTPRRR
jgi:uncharacterized membrane-anchored protein